MQHEIPLEKLGPQGKLMADPIGACVHCGFCLPTCPTYVVLGEEMDSPRGRIYLMKQMLEGELPLAGPQLDNLDACLGCQACVTACPSGVEYGDLLTAFRAHLEEDRKRPPLLRLLRTVLRETLPYPRRFRLALKLGRAGRPFQRLLPSPLRPLVDMLPEHVPPAAPLPAFTPAQGQRRARVALLAGCVQQVLSPRINQATLAVLSRNGVEVVVPPAQGCCGALALHMGEAPKARALAERNLRAFNLKDIDAIITNAAGCGSGMKEYAHLFAGLDNEEEAKALAAKVVDVSAFLDQLGVIQPGALPQPARIAYHDACHLAHAQRVRSAPRRLLGQIPNLEVLEVPEGELCCGSAGSYNLEQPKLARALQTRKVDAILSTGAEGVAAGNIGCLVQIEQGLRRANRDLPVLHTIEWLERAYRAEATAD